MAPSSSPAAPHSPLGLPSAPGSPFSSAAPPRGGLPTELVSPWTVRAHRPSWCQRRQGRTAVVLAGRATRVPHRTDNPGIERTTTVTTTPSMSWPSPHDQPERIPRICLIRMRPLVQVQPGPLRRFDLGKRSSLPLRSWLLPCVAFAQRSENTSLHSSTGANGLPRLTSGTSLALREHGYLVAHAGRTGLRPPGS
jgi:hypothetical protein